VKHWKANEGESVLSNSYHQKKGGQGWLNSWDSYFTTLEHSGPAQWDLDSGKMCICCCRGHSSIDMWEKCPYFSLPPTLQTYRPGFCLLIKSLRYTVHRSLPSWNTAERKKWGMIWGQSQDPHSICLVHRSLNVGWITVQLTRFIPNWTANSAESGPTKSNLEIICKW
jgi:hypothetical protein